MMKSSLCEALALAAAAVGAAEVPLRPYVTLPPVVYAVPGDTCAIYYRNVVDAVRPEIYGYQVTCRVGRNDGEGWTWTPTEADAGRQIPLILTLVADTCAPSVEPTGGFESGFGDNYGCGKTSFTFRSNMLLYNRLVYRCVAEKNDLKLTALPIHHNIDREKGYPKDNALHLSPAGGAMIGDALYAWLVGTVYAPDNRPYEFGD